MAQCATETELSPLPCAAPRLPALSAEQHQSLTFPPYEATAQTTQNNSITVMGTPQIPFNDFETVSEQHPSAAQPNPPATALQRLSRSLGNFSAEAWLAILLSLAFGVVTIYYSEIDRVKTAKELQLSIWQAKAQFRDACAHDRDAGYFITPACKAALSQSLPNPTTVIRRSRVGGSLVWDFSSVPPDNFSFLHGTRMPLSFFLSAVGSSPVVSTTADVLTVVSGIMTCIIGGIISFIWFRRHKEIFRPIVSIARRFPYENTGCFCFCHANRKEEEEHKIKKWQALQNDKLGKESSKEGNKIDELKDNIKKHLTAKAEKQSLLHELLKLARIFRQCKAANTKLQENINLLRELISSSIENATKNSVLVLQGELMRFSSSVAEPALRSTHDKYQAHVEKITDLYSVNIDGFLTSAKAKRFLENPASNLEGNNNNSVSRLSTMCRYGFMGFPFLTTEQQSLTRSYDSAFDIGAMDENSTDDANRDLWDQAHIGLTGPPCRRCGTPTISPFVVGDFDGGNRPAAACSDPRCAISPKTIPDDFPDDESSADDSLPDEFVSTRRREKRRKRYV